MATRCRSGLTVSTPYSLQECSSTSPFLQGYHPHPTDYQRYTKTGLQRLMRDFRELDCNVCGGPSSALAWVASEYIAAHTSTDRGYLVAKFLGRWLAFWIKYLDWFSIGRPNA